jgi:hypothetical protein
MASSGHFRRNDLPDEAVFIPTVRKPEQTEEQLMSELVKLSRPIGE